MAGITDIRTAYFGIEDSRRVFVVRFRDARTGRMGSQAFETARDASTVMRYYVESGYLSDVRTTIEHYNEYLVREGRTELWFRNNGTVPPMPVPVIQ